MSNLMHDAFLKIATYEYVYELVNDIASEKLVVRQSVKFKKNIKVLTRTLMFKPLSKGDSYFDTLLKGYVNITDVTLQDDGKYIYDVTVLTNEGKHMHINEPENKDGIIAALEGAKDIIANLKAGNEKLEKDSRDEYIRVFDLERHYNRIIKKLHSENDGYKEIIEDVEPNKLKLSSLYGERGN